MSRGEGTEPCPDQYEQQIAIVRNCIFISGRQEHLPLKSVCERIPPTAEVETIKYPHLHLEGTEEALSNDKTLFSPYSKGQVLITQFIPTGLHSCANFPCHPDYITWPHFHPHHSEKKTVTE
jgi:hypothetical protein